MVRTIDRRVHNEYIIAIPLGRLIMAFVEKMQGSPAGQLPVADRLKNAGLRPTRQRVALASLLFAKGDRHVSAEELHVEAATHGIRVSLATVYNTLHQFTGAGLLRVLSIEGTKTYFDTNISDHHHFFLEDSMEVIDVPDSGVTVSGLPVPPDGMEIGHVDIVIRLRRKN